MSSIRPPEAWLGKQVPTLDVMLFVRDHIRRGMGPDMFIGSVDVNKFWAFASGVHFHLYCCGGQDQQYSDFITWLRDEKLEFPAGGGWAAKYLVDAGGDHRQAITRFLDRCAEYVETHKP